MCNKSRVTSEAHPTFVSDATVEDIWEHVEFLESASIRGSKNSREEKGKDIEARRKMGVRWKSHLLTTSMGDRTGFRVVPATTVLGFTRARASVVEFGIEQYWFNYHQRRQLRRFSAIDCFDHSKDAFEDVVAYFPSPMGCFEKFKEWVIGAVCRGKV